MTLDINSNGSYFYKGKPRKKKEDEEKDADEHKEKDDDNASQSNTQVYEKKKADVSSLDLMGMQNALMIHKESIVHPSNSENKNLSHNNNSNNSNNSVSNTSLDNLEKNTNSNKINSENLIHSENESHSENSVTSDIAQISTDTKTHVCEDKSHTQGNISVNSNVVSSTSNNQIESHPTNAKTDNSNNVSNKIIDYENFGIIQNNDGTFSIKNNPFGKFTKETIEEYINKYIVSSSQDTWVNGYSQIYTVNNQKLFLMKVTLRNGTRAFRGQIIENETLYTIFFGVNEEGLPDENKVLKRR